MSTIQECFQKALDLVNQVRANTEAIAHLDTRVAALEGVPPAPPSPSPAPEPTPPSPSPAPEPVPPDNSMTTAIKRRSHFLPNSVYVQPGGDVEAAAATGPVELGLGDYNGFTIKNGQCVVGIPYGTRINGRVTVEAGATILLRGLMADIELAPGDTPTSGAIETTLGSITATGAYLQDMTFISCDGQHDLQDMRMHNVEFARAKSHDSGVIVKAPAMRIYGRSRADVTGLVIDSYNSLTARNRSLDFQHMTDVTLIGIDDESYETREVGPSCNLVDIGTARIMGYGGASGANANGIGCTDVDFLTVVVQGQRPDPGYVALDISGAKQAFLVGCADASTNDNGGTGRIKQRKNLTFETSGQVDPALLGDGTPWLGWEREVREPLAAFNPDPNAPDETAAINAAGSFVTLEDRPYRVDGLLLTGGRIIRGYPNTVLYSTGGPVLRQSMGGSSGGNPTTTGATLLDVRLHGGSEGILFNEPNVQVNNLILSGVSFSGQSNAGISVDNTYALDNCHFRCLTFEGPACSIKQRGTDPGGGTGPTISYIDKVFFDRAQFFGAPMDLQPTRANNLLAWRKGLSEGCNHRLAAGHNFTMFVGHSLKDSTISDTELNWIWFADCDVVLADDRYAFGYGALCEGVTFNLSGPAKPFKFDVPEVWWAYYINNGAINCAASNVDPEYVNTPSGKKGVSLFSAMSVWHGNSPWQGPKLRYSSLDTKGSQTLDDNERTNVNVL
jgi:hypothetical protein